MDNLTTNKEQGHPCCEISIHISNQGDIKIYNCSPGLVESTPGDKPQGKVPFQLGGACIPESPGHKPKKSQKEKLRPFLEKNRLPSTLAAGVFQVISRFIAGEFPANQMEKSSFSILEKLSPEVKELMACSIRKLNELPLNISKKLYNPKILRKDLKAFSFQDLQGELIKEIIQRASESAYGDASCLESEHPGLARRVERFDDVELFPPIINSVSVHGLPGYRTNTH